jgi:hypothetical protein
VVVPRIALKNVQAGMQLSRSILNSAGALLVEQGATITQEMIGKLANADIRYVFVTGEVSNGALEEMLSALETRFARTKDEPHMGRLRRLLTEHLRELYS